MIPLVLLGPPGGGKTAVAHEFQTRGWVAADVDGIVADQFGIEHKELYVSVEPEQRLAKTADITHALLDDVATGGQFVIATSSDTFGHSVEDTTGADERDRIAAMAQRGDIAVVHLTADLGTLVTRNGLMGPRSTTIIMPRREFRLMLDSRAPLYEKLADFTVDTTGLTAAEAADVITENLRNTAHN